MACAVRMPMKDSLQDGRQRNVLEVGCEKFYERACYSTYMIDIERYDYKK